MAAHVFKDAQVLHGDRDVSGILNQVQLSYACDLQDDTVLAQDSRSRKSGLITTGINMSGFFDGDADLDFFSDVGGSDEPFSFAPEGSAEGDLAYFLKGVANTYQVGNSIGELFAFTFDSESNSQLIRGILGVDAAKTASGDGGTGTVLGAVAAGQSIFAAMHVTAVSGTNPTLDMVVESDSDNTFATALDRLTFAQAIDTTSQFLSVAGPITDTDWRFNWTIGGTDTPTFQIFAVFGII